MLGFRSNYYCRFPKNQNLPSLKNPIHSIIQRTIIKIGKILLRNA